MRKILFIILIILSFVFHPFYSLNLPTVKASNCLDLDSMLTQHPNGYRVADGTLTICSGVYQLTDIYESGVIRVMNTQAPASTPIVIACEDDTVIDGGDLEAGSRGLVVENSSNVKINNCHIRNFDRNVVVTDSDHVAIYDNIFSSARFEELEIKGEGEDISVVHNEFFNDYNGEGGNQQGGSCLWIGDGVSNSEVSKNSMHSCWKAGLYMRSFYDSVVTDNDFYFNGFSAFTFNGGSGVTIINNRAYDNNSGIRFQIYEEGHGIVDNTNNILANNVIYNNGEAGIQMIGDPRGFTNHDNLIINNTVYGNERGILVELNNNFSVNTFRNNIVANNDCTGFDKSDNSVVVETYNNLYNNQCAGNYNGLIPHSTDISVNPRFFDPDNPISPDFHLSFDSPSIDAGDPSDEYSNEPMPNGGRINQGAYGNTTEAERSIFPLCIEPYVGMIITEDAILCAGDWHLPLKNNIQAAIKIEASNVRVVCEPGTVLQGNGKGIGIFSIGHESLNLENCQISNFNEGLLFRLTSQSNLKNLVISQNDKGLKFAQNSHDNTIQNISFFDNVQYDLGIFRSMVISFNSHAEKIRKVLGRLVQY